MTIQRISTYAVHQGTMADVNKTQADLFDLQKQISSGFKTDRFEGLAGQVEHFVSLEAKIRKTQTYIQQNEVVIARLNTTQKTVGDIIDIADQMQNLITLRRNPAAADNMAFKQQMLSLRTTAAAMLNTTFEGRYLFGGTNTNTPPVNDNPFPAPVAPGVPDDGYYQGSKENLTVRAQDGYEIEYNIRADDIGFQQMFAAVDLALSGDETDSDVLLGKAIDLINQAIDNINAAQAETNSNIVSLQNINERHVELKLYWEGVKEEVIKTDILSASTKVALDQAILQASFSAFSTINQLRLADFLR